MTENENNRPDHYPFEEPAGDRPKDFDYAVLAVDSWQSWKGSVIVPIQRSDGCINKGPMENYEPDEESLLDIFLAAFKESRDVCLSATHREGEGHSWVVRRYQWDEFTNPDKCDACVKDVVERLAELQGIPEEDDEDD